MRGSSCVLTICLGQRGVVHHQSPADTWTWGRSTGAQPQCQTTPSFLCKRKHQHFRHQVMMVSGTTPTLNPAFLTCYNSGITRLIIKKSSPVARLKNLKLDLLLSSSPISVQVLVMMSSDDHHHVSLLSLLYHHVPLLLQIRPDITVPADWA